MTGLNLIFLILLTLKYTTTDSKAQLNFDDHKNWPYLEDNKYSICTSVKHSPINIEIENVHCMPQYVKPINISSYDTDVSLNFTNTAMSIIARLQNTATKSYMFLGSGLPIKLSPFELVQFHFHWNSNSLT